LKSSPVAENSFLIRYPAVVVAVVACLLYLNALRLGFVYFDDDILVLINWEKISDLSNLGQAFRTDAFFGNHSPYYRPLQTVSLMADAAVGGRSPAMYHATNVVLHVFTSLGVLWCFGLLGFARPKALAAALVFAVHPLMGHAVLWIPARGDLLVTLFAVLAGGVLLRYLVTGRPFFLLLHGLAVTAAMFSKESGVMLPVLFAFLDFMRRKEASVKKGAALAGVWLISAVAWYGMRYLAIDHRDDPQVGFHAIAANLPFIPELVARFFFPWSLPVTPVFSGAITLAGIILSLGIAGWIAMRTERAWLPMVLFGAAWFLVFSIPNMFVRLSSAGDSFEYLNHRSYLPSVGFLMLIAAAIPAGWPVFSKRSDRWATGLAVLLLGAISLAQQGNYMSAHSFWGSAIEYRPDKAWFRYYLGRYHFKTNDNDAYEKYLLEAEDLKSYAEFKYQLGMIWFADRKNYEKAYEYFTAAFRQGYAEPEGRKNFIALCLESSADLYKKGEFKKAAERCAEAVVNDPSNADAAYNLGIYLVNSGQKEQAAAMWKQAIRLNPGLASAYRSLSLYYRYDAKKADSAEWYAREYVRLGGTAGQVSPGGKTE